MFRPFSLFVLLIQVAVCRGLPCADAGRVTFTERYEDVVISLTQLSANDVNAEGTIPTLYTTEAAGGTLVATTRTEYDALGRVRFAVDPRGGLTEYGYDDAGRRREAKRYLTPDEDYLSVATITPAGGYELTGFGYDNNGNQTRVTTYPDGPATPETALVTEYQYDSMNRRTHVIHPPDVVLISGDPYRHQRVTHYDGLGRRTLEVDEAGVMTGFGYDDLGRLTTVTNDFRVSYPPEGLAPIVTAYEYDEAGNLIQQTDAEGRETKYQYDELGRRTQRQLPGGSLTEDVLYEDVGTTVKTLRKQVTDFNNQALYYHYDELDRLQKVSTDSGGGNTLTAYTYTDAGRRETMADAGGTTHYTYDGLNRLWIKDTPQGELTYDYFDDGRVKSISTQWTYTQGDPQTAASRAAGIETAYDYDGTGRLWKVNGNEVYGYDGAGRLADVSYSNGVTTSYSYNSAGHLTFVDVWKAQSEDRAYFNYEYEGPLGPTGTRLTIEEKIPTPNTWRKLEYQYDDLYRLILNRTRQP